MKTGIKTVESYIKSFPKEIQILLEEIRNVIKENAPNVIESIAYGMPAYKLNGKPLVYFAAFKYHIGFYATPNSHLYFAKELSEYKQGKGSVQFPIERPVPFELIKRMLDSKVHEILLNSGK